MKEIKELFEKTEISEIKEKLEKVIQEIEKENREKQNELLEEVVKEAKKTDEKLKKDYKVIEGLYYFPEKIAPLALLAEEITADSDIEKDMLKVLKLNLNNYFKQFRKPEEGDHHMPAEEIEQTVQILEKECRYFSALRKKGVKISIFSFNARSRLIGIGTLNYNKIENKTFGIQSYYTEEPPKKESMEILLEQFGIILREVILGGSGNAPEDFLEIFEGIEMKEVDEESKEMTVLFANSFAHYIIEKMEIRVTEKYGPDWKEQSDTRNEDFVKRLMKYFDKIFEDLLKEEEEWDDNEKCPCGSGKRYKNCCKKKKIKYLKSENENEYIKSIPMHPEVEKALKSEAIWC